MKKVLVVLVMFLATGEARADIVAETIAAEAAGESVVGMYGVACVIQNRCKLTGKTPQQVVEAPFQFSGIKSKNRLKRYSEVKAIADALAKEIGKLVDITNGATHYFAHRLVTPRWYHPSKVMCIIRNHTFLKLT